MYTAKQIAAAITAAVNDCIDGIKTTEQCSEATRALWGKADELGLDSEVSAILQDQAARDYADCMEMQQD